ncbi:MAG: methionyl-tRNA formyltransferase [Phycisphaerae bacterium]|nr:methionyl-tRNA formyltransferase [Phycisphaerae bacterium]
MNAALIGSVSSSVATLQGMLRGRLEVTAVCGLHERHAAKISDFRDLRPLAAQWGTPYLAFDKVTEPRVKAFLERHRPDWLFVIGLSQLVPAAIRDAARQDAIGFHPTPLPEGRGRAPVAWTILNQRPAAANLFFLTDEPDAGDIVEQRPVPVFPDDYAIDLIIRTNVVLEQMVADLCPAFASGQVPRHPQDHSKATWYGRRRPEDGRIDWRQPASDIYRLIRAVSHPYPGAFTTQCSHADRRSRTGRAPLRASPNPPTHPHLIVWRARPVPGSNTQHLPGTIVAIDNKGPIVQTGDGLLHLTDIQTDPATHPGLATGQRLE